MRGHDNQINVFLLCHSQDVLSRRPFSHNEFDPRPGAEKLLLYERELRVCDPVRMVPKRLS
jgi:hypothetical protein